MRFLLLFTLSIIGLTNFGCSNLESKRSMSYAEAFNIISSQIDSAHKMRYNQEYENAIRLYEEALNLASEYQESKLWTYEILSLLATSNYSIGRYKDALIYIEKLENNLINGLSYSYNGYEKWKLYIKLLYLRGDILLNSGKLEEAKTSFLSALDNINKFEEVFKNNMDFNSPRSVREKYYLPSIIYTRMAQIYENSDIEKSKHFLDIAEENALKIEQKDILSEILMLKGNGYIIRGDFKEGNNCYLKSFNYLDDFISDRKYSDDFLFYDNNPTVLERNLLLKKSLLLMKIGKQEEFLLVANKLLSANKKVFTSPELFIALGDFYSKTDFNKSLKYYEEAENNQKIIDFDKKSRGKLLLSMANLYLLKKDYTNAEKKIVEAQKIAKELNDIYFTIDTEICNGKMTSEKGAKELSSLVFEDALLNSKKYNYILAEIEILNYTGIDYINDGKFEAGIAKLRENIFNIEMVRKNTIDTESKLKYFEKQTKAYKYLVYAYSKLKQPFDALKYAELVKARVMSEALMKQVEVGDLKEFSLKSIPKEDIYFEYIDIDENTIVCIALTDSNIEARVLEKRNLNLDYNILSGKSFSVDTRGIKPIKSNQNSEIKKIDSAITTINSYLLAIKEQNFQEEEKLSQGLYNFLIKPFEKEIKNRNNIVIIPDGFISYLPFETLKTSESYLIESYNVSYNHSLSILELIKERKTLLNENRVMLIGDVEYKQKEKLNNTSYDELQMKINIKNKIIKEIPIFEEMDILNLDNLNYLKYTGEEIKEIKNIFGNVDTLTKKNASESIIKEMSVSNKLNKYSIIHFAVHGFYYEQFPELSFIGLQGDKINDGILTSNEILKLKLQSNLVVLSACDTAIGKIYDGEGVVGVSSAFLIAGSKSVISTLWQISDKSTSIFFKEYYKELNRNTSLNNSLSKIKREFIKGSYGEEYKKPYYWAPFVYYGCSSSID